MNEIACVYSGLGTGWNLQIMSISSLKTITVIKMQLSQADLGISL